MSFRSYKSMMIVVNSLTIDNCIWLVPSDLYKISFNIFGFRGIPLMHAFFYISIKF